MLNLNHIKTDESICIYIYIYMNNLVYNTGKEVYIYIHIYIYLSLTAMQLKPPPPKHKFNWHDLDVMTGCGTNNVNKEKRSLISTAGSKNPDVAMHCPWKK